MSRSGRSQPNVALLVRTPRQQLGITAPPPPRVLVITSGRVAPRPNFMTLVRTPQPPVGSAGGTLAGSTSPSSGALAGDVIDAAAVAGSTPPAVGALAGDATRASPQPPIVVSVHPPAARPNVATLIRTPQPAPPSGPLPSDVASLSAWYRADAITGLSDGDPLDAWPDSSGNGYVTEQPFSLKPSYQTNEINSLPMVRFKTVGDSSDRALRSAAPISTSSHTVFAVIRPAVVGTTGDATQRDIWSGDNGSLKLQIFEGQLRLVRIGVAVLVTSATTLTADTTYIVAVDFVSGTSATIYLDGVQDATASTAQTLTASSFTYLGASGIFGGEPFFGDVAEVIVYDAALSSTDRGLVTGYLTDKYVPATDDPAALAGVTSPAAGALTTDVVDQATLAGSTSPASGALAADVTRPSVLPALVISARPQPRPQSGALLVRTPQAGPSAGGTLAGSTSPVSGAITTDVIDAAALAGATSPAAGALTATTVAPFRPPVLIITSQRAPAFTPATGAQVYAAPLEVAPASAALAGVTSPTSGALVGDVAGPATLAGSTSPAVGALTADVTGRAPQVFVVSRPTPPRPRTLTALLRTTQPALDTGVLAGSTPPAVGALAGDVIGQGVLAGSTPPASGALTTSSTVTGTLAASLGVRTSAITADVIDPAAVAAATPKPSGALTATSYYAATLAGTTPPTVGALAGTERILGAAASATPVLVGALVGDVIDTGTLAGTALLPVGAFNRAPVVHYPLHAGAPTDHVTRYQAGVAVDNAAHYLAGEPS